MCSGSNVCCLHNPHLEPRFKLRCLLAKASNCRYDLVNQELAFANSVGGVPPYSESTVKECLASQNPDDNSTSCVSCVVSGCLVSWKAGKPMSVCMCVWGACVFHYSILHHMHATYVEQAAQALNTEYIINACSKKYVADWDINIERRSPLICVGRV